MTKSEVRVRVESTWNELDMEVLSRIRETRWTSHNITLSRTESTLGGDLPLIGDDQRVMVIKDCLHLFLGRDLSGRRLVDLGCLEGGIAFEMAREGMDAVGVEGRTANFEKCELVRRYYGLENLSFLNLDVKDLEPQTHGVFDVVLCCGLLYHLDDPVSFLERLSSVTHPRSVLFLDTHVAPAEARLEECAHRGRLSGIETVEHGGTSYEGRWYAEYPEDAQGSSEEWAAVSNYRSFWLTEESLLKAVSNAGFKRIFSVHGGFEIETELKLRTTHSRLYHAAVKDAYFERFSELPPEPKASGSP